MSGTSTSADSPTPLELLDHTVETLGGTRRDGQRRMAAAVADAIATEHHLAVQAGTGTGKSLAYLVPSLAHAVDSGRRVVVSTATIALQRQLVDRDLPRVVDALAPKLGRRPSFAILKGRNNYLCLHRTGGGASSSGPDGEDALLDEAELTRTGAQVTRLRDWAQEILATGEGTGDRDSLPRGVSDQAWRQVSVTSRECVGASRCPFGEQCFAEAARAEAAEADVVVTNHALLAIDAMADSSVLPMHDVAVIDEAHELAARITSVATAELTAASLAVLARRCAKVGPDGCSDALEAATDTWTAEIEAAVTAGTAPEGRWLTVPEPLREPLIALRDALWGLRSKLQGTGPTGAESAKDAEKAAELHHCVSSCEEIHDTVVRILDECTLDGDGARRTSDAPAASASPGNSGVFGEDVVWLGGERHRRAVRVAPLSVADLLRTRLFGDSTVVLTSATLALGGRFTAMLASWGLSASKCTTLDVGTPFDAGTHGILYMARHLDPPGRDAAAPPTMDELAQLINAAGGRTLGLFSSRRAAEAAAAEMRTLVPYDIMLQGEDTLGSLIDRFRAEPETCLFGTLGLWQGVDVPGQSLSLVVMDRIPFPRPDDPLMQARKEAADQAGRNGFMEVSATHAALLMAQGAGRLLRSVDDRGVVAVLDSRIATKRYGSFFRSSMPPFWTTTDGGKVRAALRRLRA
ncbi:ATP-dependent DNA helicase [uncultured Corynebacterium sp.]|uniref:ATP-dependent DNA helicase n=1 Tax=uncultured Corynebacterium sp. TaxID=159447 RepID=UPI0025E168B0|nr:ATP-dependent DNA helicase [uncultured Corynebacterium sp.]